MTTSSNLTVRVCHADPLVMAGLVALIGREPAFDVQAGPRTDTAAHAVDVIVADYACALGLLASAGAAEFASPTSKGGWPATPTAFTYRCASNPSGKLAPAGPMTVHTKTSLPVAASCARP